MHTTHEIDEFQGRSRLFVTAPGNMLVRANQDKLMPVNVPRLFWRPYVEHHQRDVARGSGIDDTINACGGIESKKRIVRAQRIIERASSLKPQVRSAATGDGR